MPLQIFVSYLYALVIQIIRRDWPGDCDATLAKHRILGLHKVGHSFCILWKSICPPSQQMTKSQRVPRLRPKRTSPRVQDKNQVTGLSAAVEMCLCFKSVRISSESTNERLGSDFSVQHNIWVGLCQVLITCLASTQINHFLREVWHLFNTYNTISLSLYFI